MLWWQALQVVALSAAPVAELRGGLPLALAYGATPLGAYALAVAGNLLPVPFLLWGLDWLLCKLVRLPWPFGGLVARYVAWQARQHTRRLERWGTLALVALVALPLPITGAWTGCLAAVLVGVSRPRALPAIVIGVLIAGVVALLGTLGIVRWVV
ncbi:MAG: small multi-drug export protein [Candidatus Bipolaricaulota bacterium]